MERPYVTLVREVLSGGLAENVASAVLFTALDRWAGAAPTTPDELTEFARGALREVLAERLGEDASDELIGTIEERIRGARPTPQPNVEIEIKIEVEEETITRAAVLAAGGPVPVVVASAEERFAHKLRASLGPERVAVLTAHDVELLRHAVFATSALIVVVDATSPPPLDASTLVAALGRLPAACQTIVWGQETRYGRDLRASPGQAGARAQYLTRAGGIDPLLDLVLSRRRQDPSEPPRSPR